MDLTANQHCNNLWRKPVQRKLKQIVVLMFILQLYISFTGVRADIERDMPLDEIPSHIIDAITQEKQGIYLKTAEQVFQETLIMYEIEGNYNGKKVEILVSPQGEILKVKNESCDDTEYRTITK